MKPSTFAFTLSLLMSGSCIAGTASTQVDPQFTSIERIVMLPVVDSRVHNKEVKVNFKDIRGSAQRILTKSHHFAVSQTDYTGDAGEIDEIKLSSASPEWIRRLGPPDARWVLIIGLRDVQGTRRYTNAVTVFGFLFDKDKGSLLWRAEGLGQPPVPVQAPYNPQYGALNNAVAQSNAQLADALTKVLFPGLTRGETLSNAMFNLLSGPSGLPTLPRKKK